MAHVDSLGEDLQEGLRKLLPPREKPAWPGQVHERCSQLQGCAKIRQLMRISYSSQGQQGQETAE